MLTFQEALQRAENKKHLLLGNGFSIALKPDIFRYDALFEQADFSGNEHLRGIFSALGTTDFEEVVKTLESGAKVLPHYLGPTPGVDAQMQQDALRIKEILVTTIANKHPERPGDISFAEYEACKVFLGNFLGSGGKLYSLNYDILLYWVLMNSDLPNNDGFKNDPDDPDAVYVVWDRGDSRGQNVYFLHGGLHLFDAGHQIQKNTWVRSNVPLIDQAQEAVATNKFPLFVAEGTSRQKMKKIQHSGYLHKGLRSLAEISGSIFTYGVSFSENDEHILRTIEMGKVRSIFVGLYGDENSESNQRIRSRVDQIVLLRRDSPRRNDLAVSYFDCASAAVWG